MEFWEKIRDWEVSEALEDFEQDSYDFIARDFWFNDGVKADFLRYRHQNYKVEIRLYDPDFERDGRTMKNIADIRDVLSREGFRPNIAVADPQSMRTDYIPLLEGDYLIDKDSEEQEVKPSIESLTGSGNYWTEGDQLEISGRNKNL